MGHKQVIGGGANKIILKKGMPHLATIIQVY
jgi:hypothetical protein